MVLVWPNWFGLDHNDLVTTKMKCSRPKWIGQVQIVIFDFENHNLDLTNSFWSRPFHFGRDQIIMVKSKSIWSDQNHFGHIEGQGIRLIFIWKIVITLVFRLFVSYNYGFDENPKGKICDFVVPYGVNLKSNLLKSCHQQTPLEIILNIN